MWLQVKESLGPPAAGNSRVFLEEVVWEVVRVHSSA